MSNLPNYIVSVALDCTGENTKSRWVGTFQVKCIITHADRFAIERMYASLLPSTISKQVEEELIVRAETIAQLSVRIVDGPEWWNATKSGQLLVDSEPLYALLDLCKDASDKWKAELEKKAMMGSGNAIDSESPKP